LVDALVRRTIGKVEKMPSRGYTLVDVEKRARENPKTFEILSEDERASLQPGDFAKLIFQEGSQGERMWVEIAQVTGPGKYVGVLANHPAMLQSVDYGDRVNFTAKNVASVMSAPSRGGSMNGILKALRAPQQS